MVLTIYKCEDCREPVTCWATNLGSRPAFMKCPKCGGRAICKGIGQGRNANTGEMVSQNLGCGIGQEEQGNRDLADANIDAHYRKSDGALVAANSQAFDETVACRGMMSHTAGGFSTKKMHRIRDNSRRGNPRLN